MAQSRSSISSSSSLELRSLPLSWVLSVCLCMTMVFSGELAARWLLAPIGDVWAYWGDEMGNRFGWYQDLVERGEVPEVLFIGDSVGARNIDALAFSRTAGVGAFSLCFTGNFPLALRALTYPMLQRETTPSTVFLVQSPRSYADSDDVRLIEQGPLSCVMARRRTGEQAVADHVFLCRLYPARRYLRSYWLAGAPVLREPPRGGSLLFRRPEATQPMPKPRQRPAAAPVFDPLRRETLHELIGIARSNGFRVNVLVCPVAYPESAAGFDEHLDWLRSVVRASGGVAQLWDLTGHRGLRLDDFKDKTHLWGDAATRFSRFLGQTFAQRNAPSTRMPAAASSGTDLADGRAGPPRGPEMGPPGGR